MTIRRELKDWVWEFDKENKELKIWRKIPDRVPEWILTLDKVRRYSLFRFLIRASQTESTRKRGKK